jgi:predicted PurR-regulated permease PerM
MDYIISLLKKPITKRILTLAVICLFLYLMRSMMNLLLLTFLFTYLMYSAQKFIHKVVERIFTVKISKVIVTLFMYVILIGLIVLAIYKYIPIALHQIISILNEVIDMITRLKGQVYNDPILDYLTGLLQSINVGTYLENKSGYLLKLAGNVGELGLNILLSLILSLFFILEKDRVVRFVSTMKDSKIPGFFNELKYFGNRLLNSFGKVIQAQILIALCNSVLSIIGLWILGFRQLLGLGVMIFLLSLIPVAGVAISLVPLSIVAFRMGGFMQVLYVIIMILAIHAVEAYMLNPKLMSIKTNLPVFFTFLVLIISEQLMGIWGLIIGIPIFIFILDLLEIGNFDKGPKK